MCFVPLTIDPRTSQKVWVRIVCGAERTQRSPPHLPSHWVAVWLTYSEIPSSKLIAEHLSVSCLVRGGLFFFLTYEWSDIS